MCSYKSKYYYIYIIFILNNIILKTLFLDITKSFCISNNIYIYIYIYIYIFIYIYIYIYIFIYIYKYIYIYIFMDVCLYM